MSTKALRASSSVTRVQADELSQRLAAESQSAGGGVGGLTAAQWDRVATLASFVEPLTHEQACVQPLLVLPPNRLRLFNPAQALQAFVSRQLLAPGWSLRMSRIEALLPAKVAQRSFQTFFHALLPRVLKVGRNLAAHEQRGLLRTRGANPLCSSAVRHAARVTPSRIAFAVRCPAEAGCSISQLETPRG